MIHPHQYGLVNSPMGASPSKAFTLIWQLIYQEKSNRPALQCLFYPAPQLQKCSHFYKSIKNKKIKIQEWLCKGRAHVSRAAIHRWLSDKKIYIYPWCSSKTAWPVIKVVVTTLFLKIGAWKDVPSAREHRFVCIRIAVRQCSGHAVLPCWILLLVLPICCNHFEALILWGLDCLPLLICLMPSRDVELCLLMAQFRIISETALN